MSNSFKNSRLIFSHKPECAQLWLNSKNVNNYYLTCGCENIQNNCFSVNINNSLTFNYHIYSFRYLNSVNSFFSYLLASKTEWEGERNKKIFLRKSFRSKMQNSKWFMKMHVDAFEHLPWNMLSNTLSILFNIKLSLFLRSMCPGAITSFYLCMCMCSESICESVWTFGYMICSKLNLSSMQSSIYYTNSTSFFLLFSFSLLQFVCVPKIFAISI